MMPTLTSDIEKKLRAVLDALPLIDTHEHMERTSAGTYPGGDLFDILKNTFYLWGDLVSSGMPAEPYVESDTDEEKWNVLRQYLPHVRNTGYYQGVLRGLQSVYGNEFSTIDDANYRTLNERIKQAYQDAIWPEKVLREVTHIEVAINDVDGFNMNRQLFVPAIKFDYLLRGNSPQGRSSIESTDNVRLESFDDYVAHLMKKIKEFKALGAVALKTVTPYYRSLRYEPIPEDVARKTFARFGTPIPYEQQLVEDFAFHVIIAEAAELQLPVQIHTGMLAGNSVTLNDGNPANLNPLFRKYPECRFVLFHGGYPFADETGVLAKTFPNVYLDICWLPWISPALCRRYLDIWLDLVPANKIMWGGDAHRAECVHGHWLIARDTVVEVLEEKVMKQVMTIEAAVSIAKGIFRNNAIRLFGIRTPVA